MPFIVELAFRPGGRFEGDLEERVKDRVSLLKQGTGRYRAGDDVIEFGPGMAEHDYVDLSGSSYTAHGAKLIAPGHCVYVTDFTPFRTMLTIRAARV